MKDSRYHLVIFLAIISPLMSAAIWAATNPNANDSESLNIPLAFFGIVVVCLVGLLTSGVLALLKLKDRKWSLAGYVIPAILFSIRVLIG
jgi:hypothetical protein